MTTNKLTSSLSITEVTSALMRIGCWLSAKKRREREKAMRLKISATAYFQEITVQLEEIRGVRARDFRGLYF